MEIKNCDSKSNFLSWKARQKRLWSMLATWFMEVLREGNRLECKRWRKKKTTTTPNKSESENLKLWTVKILTQKWEKKQHKFRFAKFSKLALEEGHDANKPNYANCQSSWLLFTLWNNTVEIRTSVTNETFWLKP